MSNDERTRADDMVDRVARHYDAKEQHQLTETPKPENRTEKGQFPKGVSGNPGGRPKGVVDYIRANTNDYTDILDLLLKVAKGEEVDGHKPTPKERTDCVKELLDRSVGKPTQAVVETGDSSTREVLQTMQALLHKGQETAAKDKVESAEMPENVSPIDVMRTKPRRNT